MYSMDDLLRLVLSEKAEGLRLCVGKPPIIDRAGESHAIEGPAITPENAEHLLLGIANTRQRRQLRERGMVDFIHTFHRSTRFLVHAWLQGDNVGIEIR